LTHTVYNSVAFPAILNYHSLSALKTDPASSLPHASSRIPVLFISASCGSYYTSLICELLHALQRQNASLTGDRMFHMQCKALRVPAAPYLRLSTINTAQLVLEGPWCSV